MTITNQPSYDRVRNVVADILALDAQELSPDSAIDVTERWDSMQHLSIMMAVSEEFDRTFAPDELSSLVSIRQIVEAVSEN